MSQNQNNTKTEIYGFLKSQGYDPKLLSTSGKQVPVEDEAEVIGFNFTKDGEDYGSAYCSLDSSNDFTIYETNKIANSPKESGEDDYAWDELVIALRNLTFGKVKSFRVDDIDNLEHDMSKREHTKRLEEGYYPINKKASYSDNIPTVKIHIQHSRALGENEQRYRNVEKIFVENQLGERFLLDTTKPGLARVYARHIAEGGKVNDDRWNHISSLCEEYGKMAGFVRATRNNQFNESTQKLVNEGVNHYNNLRETLHKLTGKKGYTKYFESYTPSLMEDEAQLDLSEMFMSSSLDPRIECVMPILSKLNKNISEATLSEVTELEEWADNIIENELDTKLMEPEQKPEPKKPVMPSKQVPKVEKKKMTPFEESVDDDEDELIAGRYTQDQWDRMVNNVKKLAHKQQKEKELQQPKDKEEQVEETLDSNEKKVNTLGPTEKVKNNNIGKLVGATESADPMLNRIRKLSGLE